MNKTRTHKKLRLLLFVAAILVSSTAFAQTVIDVRQLEYVRKHLDDKCYSNAYRTLIGFAEKDLAAKPLSVMMKQVTPPSGNKHDYTSLSRYAWPDPNKSDGLPYIMRDGVSNPELAKYDRNNLGRMCSRVLRLSLAWYFSGDERYAEKATEQIRTWFLDKDTYMNPHLKYAQCVPGMAEGRCYGVLDALSFIEMLDGVQLLEKSKAFKASDSKKLRKWFKSFLHWLCHDPQAIEEGMGANNHSVAYDLQLAAYAKYVGNKKLFKKILEDFPEKRIDKQIEADGRQPYELVRTLAFGYSSYNIRHIIELMFMARNAGLDWQKYSHYGDKSLQKAVTFLMPYMQQPNSWPYKQISQWNEKLQEMAENCYCLWLLDPSRTDCLKAYQNMEHKNTNSLFNLLYIKANANPNQ